MISSSLRVTPGAGIPLGNLPLLPAAMEERMQQELSRVADEILAQTRSNIEAVLNNYDEATGQLRDSFVKVMEPLKATVGSSLIYARIHEFGGTIQAVNVPWLVFQVPDLIWGGSEWRKAKSVTIPQRPYLGPAVQQARTLLPSALKTSVVAGVNSLHP